MLLCAADAAYEFLTVQIKYVCPRNLDVMLAYTLYGNTSTEYLYKSMDLIKTTWMFLSSFTSSFLTFLDIAFQLDLLYTNAKPMKKPH